MIIYIAGPYRGDVAQNIANAAKVASEVWESGNVALCPHLNTAHFETFCHCEDKHYLEGDYKLLARCDAILMVQGWEKSQGAKAELVYAQERKIPVYYYPNIPPLHPTEVNRLKQTSAFIDAVMTMYRTHLDKNADYSPANILGTGEVGLVTRLWDKVARLLNLTGFKIEIASSSFDHPMKPKNESIDDAYMDLAVYGIIGILLRKGLWGQ
jgi:nucleoside 2-deoxyribosyltransferase